MALFSVMCLTVFIALTPGVHAMSTFPDDWASVYPNSLSEDIAQCQLCHESSAGGDGWNE